MAEPDPGWDIPGVPRPALEPFQPDAVLAAVGPASRGSAAASRTGPVHPAVRFAPAPGAGVRPDSPEQALEWLDGALDYLAHADAASWPAGTQADCLRALAVAESRQAAAHAQVLGAFSVPGGGLNADGHRSPRVWLTWQTQATARAAAARVGWMRRLHAHPAVAAALAEGHVSTSWARQITDWTGRLDPAAHDDADRELLAAADRGADLAGLAQVAEDQRRADPAPDADDDGFEDRAVHIATTFAGAGRIEGDLTERCTAAVSAVLDSLSAARGPEDDRTLAQRRHDALEEACTRLIAAGMLPQRAGQPVRLELDITLDELTANANGMACDALIQPVITGHVDYDLLNSIATRPSGVAANGGGPPARPWLVLEQAIALLSGPAGAAAALRRTLPGGPAVPLSLPLDIPGTYDTIPTHLRRAVRTRDRHCRFPGCDLPPATCDVHHLVHRKDGGRHALANLTLLCRFHHLIAIHRCWTLTLHPDGTTTAVSPDGTKTLRSHSPPTAVELVSPT